MLLEVNGLCSGYGDAIVLRDVSIKVDCGEIVALVGSNGAGKTTLMNTLMGLVRSEKGEIRLGKRVISREPPHRRVSFGLALVPEGRHVFPGLTVRENLLIGVYRRATSQVVQRDLEWVFTLFPELEVRLSQKAGTLSGGEQQMLAIGRALMSQPSLLLVDELSLGLAPVVVDRLLLRIRQVQKDKGIAVFLVEQDVEAAFNLASRGYILENGRIVLEGSSDALLSDDRVREAYLGL